MFATLSFINHRQDDCPNVALRAFFMPAYEQIFGVQPRVYVVMAYTAYDYRLSNGKWTPFFYVYMLKNNQL